MKKSSKPSRRSKVAYPGLEKDYNLKIRHELLDQDYISKLSEEEKQWLNNFNEEYVSANFNHRGETLHKSKKHKKAVYDANNARNRDAYAVTKSNDMLKDATHFEYIEKNQRTNVNHAEDSVIEMLDSSQEDKVICRK